MKNKIDSMKLGDITKLLAVMTAARSQHGAVHGETSAYAEMTKRIKQYQKRIKELEKETESYG